MKKRNLLAIISLSVLFLLASCNLPMMGTTGSAGTVTIVSPPDGTQLNVGQTLDIQSQVSASGAASASLLVNDAVYRTDTLRNSLGTGAIYQPWTPTEAGTYTLSVTVSSADGELASAPITVIVGEADAPASQPPTGAPPTETLPPDVTAAAIETVVLPSATVPPPTATFTYIPPTKTATATSAPLANSSILGKVFRDENGSGSFNPADTPLIGVTVFLGSGACPSSGLAVTQTASDGSYTFASLPAGQYCVTVDTSSLPNIGGTWQASLTNPAGISLGESDSKTRHFMFQPIIE